MITHPDVQRRAQEEIDELLSIKGPGELPAFEDRDSGRLEYLEAVMKEILRFVLVHLAEDGIGRSSYRWRPPAPLGESSQTFVCYRGPIMRLFRFVEGAAPHHLTSTDWYNGYCIPKGSIVIFNAW